MHPDFTPAWISRFWSHVEKTDTCWLWCGATNYGYGVMHIKRAHRLRAHRVSWELSHGPIPLGLYICHRCDVKLCVRPDHLFLGTQVENMADMVLKGRGASGEKHGDIMRKVARRGEAHPSSRLSEAQVREIMSRRKEGPRPLGRVYLLHLAGARQRVIPQPPRQSVQQH